MEDHRPHTESAAVPLPTERLAQGCAVALQWSFPASVGPWTLIGQSRAADATSFNIPELGWTLDGGMVTHEQRPDYIFITHTHSDHVFAMTRMKSRRKPPAIVVPESAATLLENWFLAAQALTDNVPIDPERVMTRAYDLHPVAPGDELRVTRGKEVYSVDVVGCTHTVPCVGYLFSAIKLKLKAEHVGKPGPELGSLRRQGVEISEEIKRPLFAYLTDTTAAVFEDHPEVLEAPVIITECTFLEEAHQGAAIRTGHTYWPDLKSVIEANPDRHFVLIHFSQRYRDEEIRAFFAEQALENVTAWVAGSPRG